MLPWPCLDVLMPCLGVVSVLWLLPWPCLGFINFALEQRRRLPKPSTAIVLNMSLRQSHGSRNYSSNDQGTICDMNSGREGLIGSLADGEAWEIMEYSETSDEELPWLPPTKCTLPVIHSINID